MTNQRKSITQNLADKVKEAIGRKLTQRQMDLAASPQLIIRKVLYSRKSWNTDEVKRDSNYGFTRLERNYPGGIPRVVLFGSGGGSYLPDFEIFGEYNSEGYLVRETVVEMGNSVTKEFSPPGRFFGKRLRSQR